MKHIFIINLNAGAGNTEYSKIRLLIQNICDSENIEYEIYSAKNTEETKIYIQDLINKSKYEDVLRFYACGGDGTLSYLAELLYKYDQVELAFIPIGTGNDFARTFGTVEQFKNIRNQILGKSVSIDLLKINNHISINIVNMGFDCAVVAEADKLKKYKFLGGSTAYNIGVINTLFLRRTYKMQVSVDSKKYHLKRYLLIAIGNGCYYGGGYKACCEAKPNDGYADIIMVPSMSRTRFVSLVSKYKKGNLIHTSYGEKNIIYKKIQDVVIHSDKPIYVCTDGDIEQLNDIKISVLHNAINFSLPLDVYLQFEKNNNCSIKEKIMEVTAV